MIKYYLSLIFISLFLVISCSKEKNGLGKNSLKTEIHDEIGHSYSNIFLIFKSDDIPNFKKFVSSENGVSLNSYRSLNNIKLRTILSMDALLMLVDPPNELGFNLIDEKYFSVIFVKKTLDGKELFRSKLNTVIDKKNNNRKIFYIGEIKKENKDFLLKVNNEESVQIIFSFTNFNNDKVEFIFNVKN